MPISFSSFGDIVTAVDLALRISKALSSSTGSSHEYQYLVQELDALAHVLQLCDTATRTGMLQQDIVRALLAEIERCREVMDRLWERIGPYQEALGSSASNSPRTLAGLATSSLRKIGWTLFKAQDVQETRAKLATHRANLTTLMTACNMSNIDELRAQCARFESTVNMRLEELHNAISQLPSQIIVALMESRGGKPPRGPIKKALIIGINYVAHENEEMKLSGAHDDARGWMEHCIEWYGFRESDITLMMDDDSIASKLRPTRANIIHEFVKDVQSGDRLVFFYSGHSRRVERKSMHEGDGLDECLIPLDTQGLGPQNTDKIILYNELRELMVDPLPVDWVLNAISDSSHSITLIDLKCFLSVGDKAPWYPWMNRGTRKPSSAGMAAPSLDFTRGKKEYFPMTGIKISLSRSSFASISATLG